MAAGVELQSLCESVDDDAPPPAVTLRSPSEAKASATYLLEFSDLVYSVKPKRRGSSRLTILHGVSGRCEAGRLLALMGASGAGKTTTVLCCRII
jgi:ABC-type glutathione transport system ATPase component